MRSDNVRLNVAPVVTNLVLRYKNAGLDELNSFYVHSYINCIHQYILLISVFINLSTFHFRKISFHFMWSFSGILL